MVGGGGTASVSFSKWLLNSHFTRGGSRIILSSKEMKVCIVPFLLGPLSLRTV